MHHRGQCDALVGREAGPPESDREATSAAVFVVGGSSEQLEDVEASRPVGVGGHTLQFAPTHSSRHSVDREHSVTD